MAQAEIQMPSVFSDNMILQRNQKLPIWGTAAPNEKIVVQLGQTKAETVADANGNWKVELAPQEMATSLELSVNAKVFTNVAIGEIWVCSGQSNMEWPVAAARNAKAEIAGANFPNIRLLTVQKTVADSPKGDFKGSWKVCSPETVKNFSAVGYFFGRELNQKIKVPIGLINSSWGGTPAESWTSRKALEAEPVLEKLLARWDKRIADFPADTAKFETETLPNWEKAVEAAKAAGEKEQTKPSAPDALTSAHRPANLFNGMIAPLIPFAIKGAIWYQGESNAGAVEQYRALFPAMIRDWRKQWGEGDFPFYFVQLANFQKQQEKPVEDGDWPLLREAQAMVVGTSSIVNGPEKTVIGGLQVNPGNDLTIIDPRRPNALSNVGMATAIDLADPENPGDIHPKNKQDVGKRLALIALAKNYGQKVEFSGPIPLGISVWVEGKMLIVHFSHTNGLKVGFPPLGIASARNEISGMPRDHWAYLALDKMVQLGLFAAPTTEFTKHFSMTRHEFAIATMQILEKISNAKKGEQTDWDSLGIRDSKLQTQVMDVMKALADEFQDDLEILTGISKQLKGFAIAGEDGVWHWADAKIEGDSVILSSAEVPAPTKVRYNWALNPIGNLYNSANLPAAPFRSDGPVTRLRTGVAF